MTKLHYDTTPVIAITIDTDWAPVECIQATLSILETFEVPATIFATVDVPRQLLGEYDLGVHPNFQGATQDYDSIEKEISRCLSRFPSAKGMRAHGLVTSARHHFVVRDCFPQIKYISNYYMPYVDHIRPFVTESQSIELPIYWMDNLHLEMNKGIELESLLKIVERPGLKVFAFHPFHIFINSLTKEHFEEAKDSYDSPRDLLSYRSGGNGVRTFFEALLSVGKKRNYPMVTCQDVIADFQKMHDIM